MLVIGALLQDGDADHTGPPCSQMAPKLHQGNKVLLGVIVLLWTLGRSTRSVVGLLQLSAWHFSYVRVYVLLATRSSLEKTLQRVKLLFCQGLSLQIWHLDSSSEF